MNIVHVLEAGMLVCFGISWPFNIAKSLRSRTAKGKSVAFELLIIAGYLCGLVGKFILGNLSYVVFFYIADILMVAADLVLTLRNRRLDASATKYNMKKRHRRLQNRRRCFMRKVIRVYRQAPAYRLRYSQALPSK